MKNFRLIIFITALIFPIAGFAGTKWVETFISPVLKLRQQINTVTGKVLKENVLFKDGVGFYDAEKDSDGNWQLSNTGKAMQRISEPTKDETGGAMGNRQ